DFVADLRAPTPSAAAEKISPDQREWIRQVDEQAIRLANAVRRTLQRQETQLMHLAARLRDPRRELMDKAQRMDELDMRLGKAMNTALEQRALRADHLKQRLLMQSPGRRLDQARDTLLRQQDKLEKAIRHRLDRHQERLSHTSQTLHVVSPLATLGRGYAITRRESDGAIIRDANDVSTGDVINTRLAKGDLTATVTEVHSSRE
ncbi:MAG: exodeoxyribonuclease VII large subunit, partial [Marinobacter sp.]|nr:exodeoxyribonuclease VII large subunit [Marinobacter sp.]